ncbi:MAG: methionine--tRNA ligase, partial [Spirochaetales bacterium]|nr:methionine--tRNA ligase [Spirochaetales bacterium]
AVLIRPYLPTTSDSIAGFINWDNFDWSCLGDLSGLSEFSKPKLLFKQLEDDQVEELKTKYSGSQAERQGAEAAEESLEAQFAAEIDIRAAKITSVEQHPNAEKLYVITLDCGEEEERTICSGLVNDYTMDELNGKTILLVSNLKPAKLRGIKSNGMLLAAETSDEKTMEVLFVQAEPGTRVFLEGQEDAQAPEKRIKIDRFFEIPVKVDDYTVKCGETSLTLNGAAIKAVKVQAGSVG